MLEMITEQYKSIDIEDVQEQERRESILRMAVNFERFVLNYSHHHLSESTPQINNVSKSLGEWTFQFVSSDVGHEKINLFFFLRKILARETTSQNGSACTSYSNGK